MGEASIVVGSGRLRIGDVSVPLRKASTRRLVPNPAFVAISGHVVLLRELLIDWSLGQHLLLLGEQGVGKNKLADKLLHLLDAEREYVFSPACPMRRGGSSTCPYLCPRLCPSPSSLASPPTSPPLPARYVQLHRDTTVSSLTLHPVLEDGAIRYDDSALVRAARLELSTSPPAPLY